MSADNGIYILVTPKEGTTDCEFRVVHCQAIENIYWDAGSDSESDEIQPERLKEMFGNAEVHWNQDLARDEAFHMASDIEEDGVLEYGIREIHYFKPFPK